MPHFDPVGMLAVFGLFVVPSVTIATRLLIRPVTEALLRLRGVQQPATPPSEDPRIAALEEEVLQLREELRQVRDAVSFDAQLRSGASRESQLLTAAAPELNS